jgi:hypothetical protein
LQKSFLDPQYIISSLNRWGKKGNPHRLGASGSFRPLSFHVGLKSGVTNSKKIEKMWDLRVTHFMWPRCGKKIQTLRKSVYQKVSSHKWPIAFEVAWLLG